MISARHAFMDVSILVLLVVGCFFLRLTDLTIRGEESRWATVAMEMKRGGDWIVPRQQGEPFLSRPPMGSWLIALAAGLRGRSDLAAVRLPSVLAMLALTLLIYAFGRSFLSRLGAFGSAVAFTSMPEVQQMGRLAESDIIFAAFLAGALLVWFWGWSQNWSAWATWGISCTLAAFATLTKGPQATVCFFGTVWTFLLLRRQLIGSINWAHLAGLILYGLILGAWLVPYYLEGGPSATWRIMTGDSVDRFIGLSGLAILGHLVRYPLEVLGCTAPWSWLTLAYASLRFRGSLGPLRPQVMFLTIAVAITFVPCWASPGGQTRYVIPMYPCVALLVGCVLDRTATMAASPRFAFALAALRRLTACVFVGAALAITWLTWGPSTPALHPWRQPAWFAVLFAVAGILSAVWQWRYGPFAGRRSRLAGLAATAGFMGLIYSGPVVNQLVARSAQIEVQMADLRRHVPGRVQSLGSVHHKFAYELRKPIALLPGDETDLTARVLPGEYLCYTCYGNIRKPLPFPAEEIAAISMDRNRCDPPQVQVIVARRSLGQSTHDGVARR
jgi:4-amino-4-deoxy-L-arabinose transferase-like glycosyltransferase